MSNVVLTLFGLICLSLTCIYVAHFCLAMIVKGIEDRLRKIEQREEVE